MDAIAQPMTAAYFLGFVGMLLGIPPCLYLMMKGERLGEDSGHYGVLLLIPGFAALMYLTMALGIGEVTFQGYDVPLPRYVDWLVTTPVLVGYAGHVAGANRGTILGLVVADALMILLGGAALALSPPGQWVAFGLSAVCHMSLLAVLYGPIRQSALEQLPARRRLARLLISHVGLLWIAYPVVWACGPGLQVVSPATITVMIVYMDVVAKVPYVYFVYRSAEDIAVEAGGRSAPAEAPASKAPANAQSVPVTS